MCIRYNLDTADGLKEEVPSVVGITVDTRSRVVVSFQRRLKMFLDAVGTHTEDDFHSLIIFPKSTVPVDTKIIPLR
jgi:hypothetical protein